MDKSDRAVLRRNGTVWYEGRQVLPRDLDSLPPTEARRAALHLAAVGRDLVAQRWLDAHPRADRGQRAPREGSLAVALGACLRSSEPRLYSAALAVIREALEPDGVVRSAAAQLGIQERVIWRWLATCWDLQAARSQILERSANRDMAVMPPNEATGQ